MRLIITIIVFIGISCENQINNKQFEITTNKIQELITEDNSEIINYINYLDSLKIYEVFDSNFPISKIKSIDKYYCDSLVLYLYIVENFEYIECLRSDPMYAILIVFVDNIFFKSIIFPIIYQEDYEIIKTNNRNIIIFEWFLSSVGNRKYIIFDTINNIFLISELIDESLMYKQDKVDLSNYIIEVKDFNDSIFKKRLFYYND